ncbi:hypothetical protein [Methylobacterium radiodurans]|uniref:Uncharacterized protein n=1 Tax=Methylobacterium radiodurans TaxID=2202828 RepID=A0A2U8VQ22_9HYPH|nr:hypothetical protein [Methylobacterium radiodurans]AWN35568.1 hypothetical protein DK427_07325 [Methylobacterium radiodurans]
MKAPPRPLSPTQELTNRLMRVVRTCPQAAAEVLELVYLASRIEAATEVDHAYRDARRVISRLRNPLWEMGPSDREALRTAAETIRRVCRIAEADIPVTPTADAGERARVEARLAAVLKDELRPEMIARVTGIVAAALQE